MCTYTKPCSGREQLFHVCGIVSTQHISDHVFTICRETLCIPNVSVLVPAARLILRGEEQSSFLCGRTEAELFPGAGSPSQRGMGENETAPKLGREN